jgi:hypothetical protein
MVNYYSSYIPMFAEKAAPLQEKLKVGRDLGKKGSKFPIHWSPEDLETFKALKDALLHTVPLHILHPDQPYVLRCDASAHAVGASLEQLPYHVPNPESLVEAIKKDHKCTRPVAFLSRKLSPGPAKNLTVRE